MNRGGDLLHLDKLTANENNKNDLWEAIRCSRWDKARELLNSRKGEAFVRYNHDVIFWACTIDAPLDILRLLHSLTQAEDNANVDSWAATDLALFQNTYGSSGDTPLHASCCNATDDDVVLFILDVPGSDVAVRTPNSLGKLPLHLAVENNRSARVVEKLLLVYPEGIDEEDAFGFSPMTFFWKKWDVRLQMMGGVKEVGIGDYDASSFSLTNQAFQLNNGEEFFNMEEVLLLLIKAHCHGTVEKLLYEEENCDFFPIYREIEFLPLHSALQIEDIPPIFISFLIGRYLEHVKKQDDDGNLPLHLTLLQENPMTKYCSKPLISILFQNSPSVLQHKYRKMLLQQYPDGALVQNKKKYSPLSIAIEKGLEWDDGVKEIVDYVPNAVTEALDPRTGFYPFMFSLVSPKSPINVAFEFLRLDPSIVQIGIP